VQIKYQDQEHQTYFIISSDISQSIQWDPYISSYFHSIQWYPSVFTDIQNGRFPTFRSAIWTGLAAIFGQAHHGEICGWNQSINDETWSVLIHHKTS
jgi:hypothetical protein